MATTPTGTARARGKEDTVSASDNEAQMNVALVPVVKAFAISA